MKLTAAFLLITLTAPAGAQESAYRVIVHPENGVREVERKFLSDAFLKKTTGWPGGEQVRPVARPADSPIRRRFSQHVLGRTLPAVKSYWQQLIFSGRDVPPPELDTEDKVVEYVRKNRGAIGYVSPQADVSGVKVLSIQ